MSVLTRYGVQMGGYDFHDLFLIRQGNPAGYVVLIAVNTSERTSQLRNKYRYIEKPHLNEIK